MHTVRAEHLCAQLYSARLDQLAFSTLKQPHVLLEGTAGSIALSCLLFRMSRKAITAECEQYVTSIALETWLPRSKAPCNWMMRACNALL